MMIFIYSALDGKNNTNISDKSKPLNKSIEALKESASRILLLIKNNPNITASEIALELNISSSAAQKQIANLKSLGIIE
jgi:ATP-dependent DNA helicase RecG